MSGCTVAAMSATAAPSGPAKSPEPDSLATIGVSSGTVMLTVAGAVSLIGASVDGTAGLIEGNTGSAGLPVFRPAGMTSSAGVSVPGSTPIDGGTCGGASGVPERQKYYPRSLCSLECSDA